MFILAFRQISCLFGLSSLVLFCPPTTSSDKIELTSDRPNRHDICLKAKINYNIGVCLKHRGVLFHQVHGIAACKKKITDPHQVSPCQLGSGGG